MAKPASSSKWPALNAGGVAAGEHRWQPIFFSTSTGPSQRRALPPCAIVRGSQRPLTPPNAPNPTSRHRSRALALLAGGHGYRLCLPHPEVADSPEQSTGNAASIVQCRFYAAGGRVMCNSKSPCAVPPLAKGAVDAVRNASWFWTSVWLIELTRTALSWGPTDSLNGPNNALLLLMAALVWRTSFLLIRHIHGALLRTLARVWAPDAASCRKSTSTTAVLALALVATVVPGVLLQLWTIGRIQLAN